jgi:hypothetical protein
MTTVLWRSEADDDVAVLLRHSHTDEACAMFHTAIADVLVDGVGTLWTEEQPYDAAQLPCGHVFNACAIATHFCTNDMRCPVCRRGPHNRARLDSMAACMQPALRKKREDMLVASAVDDDDEFELQEPVLDRDIVFTARLHSASPAQAVARCVVIATPLRLSDVSHTDTADPGHREHLHEYSTHRSFQRLFNLHLRDANSRENCVVFSIAHPLLPDGVHSAALSAHDLELLADMRVRIPLSRDMGFVLPTHCDTGLRITLYINTAYITMVCVQAAIGWQNYLRL